MKEIFSLFEIEGQSCLVSEIPYLIFSVQMLRPFVISLWHPAVKPLIHMSNAWHFISPASGSLCPQENVIFLELFQWILNYGTNVGSRWCRWRLAFQKHVFVVGIAICIQTETFKTLTMNIFTRTSTFGGCAGWLQRQMQLTPELHSFWTLQNTQMFYSALRLRNEQDASL